MTSQLWHWQASNTTVIAFGQADGLSDDAAQSHCLCDHQKHRQVPIGYNKQMARKQYVKDDDTKHMSEKGSWKSAQLRNDPRQISRQKRHLHPHRPGGRGTDLHSFFFAIAPNATAIQRWSLACLNFDSSRIFWHQPRFSGHFRSPTFDVISKPLPNWGLRITRSIAGRGLFIAPLLTPKLLGRLSKFKQRLIALEKLSNET